MPKMSLRWLTTLASIFTMGALVSGAAAVNVPTPEYPPPGGVFVSANEASVSEFDLDIERVVAVSRGSSEFLPPPSSSKTVDSFFDVFLDVSIGNSQTATIDSFFDITFDLTNQGGGTFETEIVSMSLLASDIPALDVRESSTQTSIGQTRITDLGNGSFEMDSFFDLWLEVSFDGVNYFPADKPIAMNLQTVVPEPSTIGLAAVGMSVLCFGRRRRRRR